MWAVMRGAASFCTMWPAPSTLSTVAPAACAAGTMQSSATQTTSTGPSNPAMFSGSAQLRAPSASQPVREGHERFRHPVEALVRKEPVDERAIDETRGHDGEVSTECVGGM